MTRGFLYAKSNMLKEFKERFLFEQPEPLLDYLRYVFIEFFLNGLRMEASAEEFLLGYEHPFIGTFKYEDPSTGLGDPSLLTKLGLSPNVSLDEASDYP